MNILSRDQQIQIIAALTEGMSIRAVERLTGIHRDTIMRLCGLSHAGLSVFTAILFLCPFGCIDAC